MDTGADEACNTPPATPHSLEYNSLVAMLHRTAIQSLSDLPAATDRLKSTAEMYFCLHKMSNVLRFYIQCHTHLKNPVMLLR